MAVTAGAEIKAYFSINQGLAINTFGLIVTGNPVFNQGLADSIGAAVKSSWNTNLAAYCAAATSLVRVGIRDLRGDHLPEFRESGAAVAGSFVGDNLPSQLALCITLRTAGSGKSFRGRLYIGGFGEGNNLGLGTANQTAATQAIAWITGVDSAVTSSGMRLAVLQRPSDEFIVTEERRHGGQPVSTRTLSHTLEKTGIARQVTIVESRNLAWETQRRRNNGRGALPTSLVSAASVELPA